MLKVVQAGDFPATLRRTMRRVLALFVAVSLVLLPLPARADLRVTPVWYDQNAVGTAPDWHYRVPITVPAGTSINSTIKVDVNFNTLLTQMGISGTFDVNSPRVVRPTGVLAATQEFTDAVFAGATDAAGDGKGEMRFILEDAGPATYYLYFDITQNGVKPANPQTPINGNFEKGGTGTGTPPGWNAPTIGIAGGDAQIRPSEVVSVTTTPAPLTGANPRNTDGSPNTGQFSYMLGLRTTNTLAAGTIAYTKTIVVPALTPGNITVRWRPEGWDSSGFDTLTIAIVGTTTANIVGPPASLAAYVAVPNSPAFGNAQATATTAGFRQYNGYDCGTNNVHTGVPPMAVACGTENWFSATASLAAFAGQTVTLRFTYSGDTADKSWFHVDDVEWSVVSGVLGTPQAFGVNIIAPNDTAAGAASLFVVGNKLVIRAQVDAAPTTGQVTADVINPSGTVVAAGVKLFNDGTHGDAVANDNIWTNDGSVVIDPTYTFLVTDPPGTGWLLRVFARDGSISTIGASNGLVHIPGQPNTPANQANFYNIDEQVFTLAAQPSVTKVSAVISDPVNNTSSPKAIPGAVVEYTLLVSNPGPAMTVDSVVITDTIPANTALCVNATCGASANPVAFTQGATTSALTYTFTSLASVTDDVSFSTTGSPAVFTYTPVPAANGCDANVAAIRINPKGTFASGVGPPVPSPLPSFTAKIRVCIK